MAATLKKANIPTVIVSGGFVPIVEYVRQKLGFTHGFANHLEVIDGKITGNVIGDVIDASAKARILKEMTEKYNVSANCVVAVGDGANDLDMISSAFPHGIAYCAKQVLREKVTKHNRND